MNTNKIFIGPIHHITEYYLLEESWGLSVCKSEEIIPGEEQSFLIKLGENQYVRLQDFHFYLTFRKLFPEFMKDKILQNKDLLSLQLGKDYILEEELHPYLDHSCNVSLNKIKKEQVHN